MYRNKMLLRSNNMIAGSVTHWRSIATDYTGQNPQGINNNSVQSIRLYIAIPPMAHNVIFTKCRKSSIIYDPQCCWHLLFSCNPRFTFISQSAVSFWEFVPYPLDIGMELGSEAYPFPRNWHVSQVRPDLWVPSVNLNLEQRNKDTGNI